MIVGTVIPTAAGLFGVLWGVHTYSQSQLLKRKEIIFPLIAEFDGSERMEIAKKLLDDFSDIKRKFFEGNNSIIADQDDGHYPNDHLEHILRCHKKQNDDSKEREILRSFDDGEKRISIRISGKRHIQSQPRKQTR